MDVAVGAAVPTVLHEALRDLFAQRPDLLAPLLPFHPKSPGRGFVAVDSELTDPRMVQLLPDVVLAYPSAERPRLIVIVEVQLWIAAAKRWIWPQYLTSAYGRHRCAVVLVVITTSAKVERWARRPIRMGEGSVIVPRVVGPSSIPMMDALEIARAPGVAMLSTLAHQEDPGAAQQALWTLEALATGGHDAEGRLADILQAALTAAVREEMERLMRSGKYEYQSEFAKTYFTRGRVEGRTQTLLEVLRSRGWSLTDEVVQRIESERDEDRLQAWTRRAVTCAHVDDVFADG